MTTTARQAEVFHRNNGVADLVDGHAETGRFARVNRGWRRGWYRLFRSRRARRLVGELGWDQPNQAGTFTSSGQLPTVMTALSDTTPGVYGPPLGTNLLTGQLVWESPFGLYQAGIVTSPNVCILGDLGVAKSTLVKVMLGRLIGLPGTTSTATGMRGRAVVFDRKRQQRGGGVLAGEYHALADVVGGTTVFFHRNPAVGTRINILDPAIVATGGSTSATLGQDWLLILVTEGALGRPLHEFERWALTVAHRTALTVAAAEDRVPVLEDVFNALSEPDEASLARMGIERGDALRWGLPVKVALEDYLTGRLSGLIDGETRGPLRPDGSTTPIDFTSPLLVFDTSALELGSTELGVMMAVATAYVMSVWINVAGPKMVVIEETYSADGLDIVPQAFRDLAKRARGVGASVVSVFHHLSDVSESSPLRSLITESEIICAFRQAKEEDADAVVRLLNVDPSVARTLMVARRGVHLRKAGSRPITFVDLVRTPVEQAFCYTDNALSAEGQ